MRESSKSWKSFDFGPEQKLPRAPATPTKTPDISVKMHVGVKKSYSQKSFDFYSQLAPSNVTDLSVHPKKIEEVKHWLEKLFSNPNNNKNTSFLLLSGPTGSGKTATLNVLCKDMNIAITEWINPIDQDFELLRGPNQVNRFLEFITTESNYTSLFEVSNPRRIILVEDFPNIFLRNKEEFANILEECHYKSKYPIVFICTEVSNNKINLVYSLFPQEVLEKYHITHITFNACAPTLLKNCLRRAYNLVQTNKNIFQIPSSNVVDAIVSSSMGDIRCAVNQYYFASLLGSEQMPTEKSYAFKHGAKRKRSEKSSSIKIMAKDETLGLFHALGRILNPKRKEYEKSWRLNCDLESLIMELEAQPESLVSFSFANYIKYFGDLNEIQQASDLLCLAQKFFDKWTERSDLYQYPLWITVLGLMTVNNHKVSKWNQIEGPKKINKNIIRNQDTLSNLDKYYVGIITKCHEVRK